MYIVLDQPLLLFFSFSLLQTSTDKQKHTLTQLLILVRLMCPLLHRKQGMEWVWGYITAKAPVSAAQILFLSSLTCSECYMWGIVLETLGQQKSCNCRSLQCYVVTKTKSKWPSMSSAAKHVRITAKLVSLNH